MTRHQFAIASSLVLSTLLVMSSWAQDYPNQGTMPGLRPGWSREPIDPAIARNRYVVSPAPVKLASDTSSNSGYTSFLPNWFNWKGTAEPERGNSNGSRSSYGRPGGMNSNRNQPASNMPSDAMPPDPATMQDDGAGNERALRARQDGTDCRDEREGK